jgi:GH25 family lysozyme M1 (1,4-beta-N-acetylmuramidase)
MTPRLVAALVAALAVHFCVVPASAQELELTDDLSRGDLLEYARTLGKGEKAFPDRFKFAKDAAERPEWLFGIDVSHHDGTIDWSQTKKQKIIYAYVKATQGVNLFDGKFKNNWENLGALLYQTADECRG